MCSYTCSSRTFSTEIVMAEAGCANCGRKLTQSSFKRRKLKFCFTPETASILFPTIDLDAVICKQCVLDYRHATVHTSGKRSKRRLLNESPNPNIPEDHKYAKVSTSTGGNKRHIPTPGESPTPKLPRLAKKKSQAHVTPGKKDTFLRSKIVAAVKRSHYKTAVGLMINSDQKYSEVISALRQVIQKEVNKLSREEIFSQPLTEEALQNFSWDKLKRKCYECAPLLSDFIYMIFPKAKTVADKYKKCGIQKSRTLTEDDADQLITKRAGLVIAMAISTKFPKRNKFIQSCIGVELRREGCSPKLFKTFNQLGISQGKNASRGHVENLAEIHHSKVLKWKSDVEFYKRNDVLETIPNGYVLGWDNVQVANFGKPAKQKDMLGMCFAVKNRISTIDINTEKLIPARLQSAYSFLPSSEEYLNLRNRMVFIVQQMLTDHLAILQDLSVPKHYNHKYSEQMSAASETVALGELTANPNTTEGVTEIMQHLQRYIPRHEDEISPVLCVWDNLSGEKMKISRSATTTDLAPEVRRLEGVEECPQEFHKEALLLQDVMNKYYNERSATQKGTIANLGVLFNHRPLRTKVLDNFKEAWELFEFATVAYIVLLALRLRNMESLHAETDECRKDSTKWTKQVWCQRLSQEVVETVWFSPNADKIRTVANAFKNAVNSESQNENIYPFCFCESLKDEEMVLCCSLTCPRQWFHINCIQWLPPNPRKDWYCSPQCRYSTGYVYCLCRKKMASPMVQCSLEADCCRREWYHLRCIGMSIHSVDELPEKWYCCEECELGAAQNDYVQNYSKSLVWDGLNLLARRDAVREGDGPAMIEHWKMDMLQFWSSNHDKYFLTGCRLLAGVGGALPERLREDLTWNRVANVKGVPGENIGLDLLSEYMKSDFKYMVKRSSGCHNQNQYAINRQIAQMSGAFGQQLDHLFTDGGLGDMQSQRYESNKSWFKRDVEKFVETFADDALFDHIPIRCHEEFTNFSINTDLQSPEKMGEKLAELAKSIEVGSDLARDTHGLLE